MRLAFIGDVVGRRGREVVQENLPRLKARLGLDFIVLNGENAAGGFGITPRIAAEFHDAGVDCITTGNHVWDQREIIGYLEADRRILRPANFPEGTPGRGVTVLPAPGGRQVMVLNVMARLFMDPLDDPFAAVDRLLADIALPRDVDAVILDFHGEASSEKMAMGHYLDGRVTLVVGTHTHVPSADLQILPGGTAYQTDAGMCGDFDSVIGMKKDAAIHRFIRKMPGERLSPAEGPATLCGLVVETDDRTGLAVRVEPLRLGGRLAPAIPDFDRVAAAG
jgi:hypothetical protein